MNKLLVALTALAVPVLAVAQQTGDAVFDGAIAVPEPETLALLGAGAAAWMLVRWRNRK